MNGIPSLPALPADGWLRALAVTGSIALVLFALAFAVALRTPPRRQAWWPLALITLALATGVLGRLSYRELHYAGVFLTLGTAIAGARASHGPHRALLILGTLFWLVAVGSARALFH